MVLLIEKLAKHYFKLEKNRHHPITHPPQPEELSSSLHAFRSHVSKSIDQVASDLKPGSETLSLTWFLERCFSLMTFINKAFAKLVVDIDYPMSKWEIGSTEGYLSYSLNLLELLNSISCCLSHLGQARLSLAHGLTLVEKENSPKHLKAIQFQQGCFNINFGKDHDEEEASVVFSGKEWIVHEAVKEMRSIGFWVFGVLLSCLHGDGKPYMELRKIAGMYDSFLVATLDSRISEQFMQKMPIFSEIKEVNDVVADLLVVASDELRNNELQTKLRVLQKLSDDTSKEVDNLFANLMTQRSKLIDGFRVRHKKNQVFDHVYT